MYRVVRAFKDTDGCHYKVGDTYPHKKIKKPAAARFKVLSSTDNKYNAIFIADDKKDIKE